MSVTWFDKKKDFFMPKCEYDPIHYENFVSTLFTHGGGPTLSFIAITECPNATAVI